MNYYKNALKYAGTPYLDGGMTKKGMDCSGLVNASTGQTTRVWNTAMGMPPGKWKEVTQPATSHDNFISQVKTGDLFVWVGHAAYYAGGEKLFHARKPWTVVGFTEDLKLYWLKTKGYPRVYRQI